MLTREEVQLVQASWLAVAGDRERAGKLFYDTLFRTAPEVESLFTNDASVQGRKLMETIAILVDALENLDVLVPLVEDLGRFHANIGITPAQYDVVGQTLIETLRQIGGESFDADSERAWRKVYDTVAEIMMEQHSLHFDGVYRDRLPQRDSGISGASRIA